MEKLYTLKEAKRQRLAAFVSIFRADRFKYGLLIRFSVPSALEA
ncbi:MAG: hypothetical protein QW128_01190 [Thermoprotei archaeon]